MKLIVYRFMQNGADRFINGIIIKNQKFSASHMVKMKLKDWPTLAPFFSLMYASSLFVPPQETEKGFSFHVNLILTLYLLAHYSASKGNIPTVSIDHYGKVRGNPN